MNKIITFEAEFDYGRDGVTEENATHAQIWDGDYSVATLSHNGFAWQVDYISQYYLELDPDLEGEFPTVDDMIKTIEKALEKV